jgi:hypothetical protein
MSQWAQIERIIHSQQQNVEVFAGKFQNKSLYSILILDTIIDNLQLTVFALNFQIASVVAITAADPYYGYGGVAHHPYGGTSYVQNSPWGLSGAYRYKRSADPEPEARYGGYGGYGGHGGGYGHGGSYGHGGYGGYGHGGYGGRYSGYRGKRSAVAEPGYGYGGYGHGGYGHGGYGHGGYRHGGYGGGYGYGGYRGKRSAEAEAGYGGYGYGGYGHGSYGHGGYGHGGYGHGYGHGYGYHG